MRVYVIAPQQRSRRRGCLTRAVSIRTRPTRDVKDSTPANPPMRTGSRGPAETWPCGRTPSHVLGTSMRSNAGRVSEVALPLGGAASIRPAATSTFSTKRTPSSGQLQGSRYQSPYNSAAARAAPASEVQSQASRVRLPGRLTVLISNHDPPVISSVRTLGGEVIGGRWGRSAIDSSSTGPLAASDVAVFGRWYGSC